jgi:hypothetical protein
MDTYVILRRGGWRSPQELQQAAERSTAAPAGARDCARGVAQAGPRRSRTSAGACSGVAGQLIPGRTAGAPSAAIQPRRTAHWPVVGFRLSDSSTR